MTHMACREELNRDCQWDGACYLHKSVLLLVGTGRVCVFVLSSDVAGISKTTPSAIPAATTSEAQR